MEHREVIWSIEETRRVKREVVTAARMWAVIGLSVAAYEALVDEEQLLSRGVDRARALHPAVNVVVSGAIVVTAAHLLRTIPPKLDPYSRFHSTTSRLRTRSWLPVGAAPATYTPW